MSGPPHPPPRVLVLGNAGLDLRILLPRLPVPGETLLGADATRAPGGKGLNQAVCAARAGAAVVFCAPLGQDAQGDEVALALAAEGFAGLVLPRMPHPTDFSLLMVLPDGENSITGAGPCAAALAPRDAGAFAAGAEPGDLLLLQGNLSVAATAAALRAAAGRGARTMLNTAPLWWDPAPLLPLCHVVVANAGEARAITGKADPGRAAAHLGHAGVALAIVTLGAEGCLTRHDGIERHWPAPAVRAVDTTGCGDTVCGVLAATLGRGLDVAVPRAQAAAALAATRPGAYAALPARHEIGGWS